MDYISSPFPVLEFIVLTQQQTVLRQIRRLSILILLLKKANVPPSPKNINDRLLLIISWVKVRTFTRSHSTINSDWGRGENVNNPLKVVIPDIHQDDPSKRIWWRSLGYRWKSKNHESRRHGDLIPTG